MGEAAHHGDAEPYIQQPVQGIDRKGKETLLVITSGQGVTYFECSNYNRICADRRIRYLCSTTDGISGPCYSGILGLIYTGYRFPQILFVQKIRIIVEAPRG